MVENARNMAQGDQDTLAVLLADVPEETLAAWYVDLNRSRWPEDCPVMRPHDFDEMVRRGTYSGVAQKLWDYIHAHTSAQSRSRAWWLLALGRSEADWLVYWALPVCPVCELRHADAPCLYASHLRHLFAGGLERLRRRARRFARLVRQHRQD